MSRRRDVDAELREYLDRHSSAPPPAPRGARKRVLERMRDVSDSAVYDLDELQREAREQAIAVLHERERARLAENAAAWRKLAMVVVGAVFSSLAVVGTWAILRAIVPGLRP